MTSESDCGKAQFSIRKMMIWTAIVAGAMTVWTMSHKAQIYPFYQVIGLSFYTVVVCGILSLKRDPKSFDVWFPTGKNLFVPVFMGLIVLVRSPRMFDDPTAAICGLFSFAGIPYGMFLIVLNVRRIKRREFSLSILVYHLWSWLGWISLWTVFYLVSIGAYYRRTPGGPRPDRSRGTSVAQANQ